MTTYSFTFELDDTEMLVLSEALKLVDEWVALKVQPVQSNTFVLNDSELIAFEQAIDRMIERCEVAIQEHSQELLVGWLEVARAVKRRPFENSNISMSSTSSWCWPPA